MVDKTRSGASSMADRMRLNDREWAVLSCIARRAHTSSRSVAIGRKELIRATGLTSDQTLRACRSLDRRGLLDVRERYREDGGRSENVYTLTEAALASLR